MQYWVHKRQHMEAIGSIYSAFHRYTTTKKISFFGNKLIFIFFFIFFFFFFFLGGGGKGTGTPLPSPDPTGGLHIVNYWKAHITCAFKAF